eukprot:gnl/Chilomastix_cuspidata/3448.p1 GENE.gnl/Chilomastix_cuspidata/3448~~gnl/Chilomastix_cuspidata/3448.p1  ORF type:complete len:3750 (+),score=294.57 gnl/Chilomastix_cuspidata/3448:1483-11250(+)
MFTGFNTKAEQNYFLPSVFSHRKRCLNGFEFIINAPNEGTQSGSIPSFQRFFEITQNTLYSNIDVYIPFASFHESQRNNTNITLRNVLCTSSLTNHQFLAVQKVTGEISFENHQFLNRIHHNYFSFGIEGMRCILIREYIDQFVDFFTDLFENDPTFSSEQLEHRRNSLAYSRLTKMDVSIKLNDIQVATPINAHNVINGKLCHISESTWLHEKQIEKVQKITNQVIQITPHEYVDGQVSPSSSFLGNSSPLPIPQSSSQKLPVFVEDFPNVSIGQPRTTMPLLEESNLTPRIKKSEGRCACRKNRIFLFDSSQQPTPLVTELPESWSNTLTKKDNNSKMLIYAQNISCDIVLPRFHYLASNFETFLIIEANRLYGFLVPAHGSSLTTISPHPIHILEMAKLNTNARILTAEKVRKIDSELNYSLPKTASNPPMIVDLDLSFDEPIFAVTGHAISAYLSFLDNLLLFSTAIISPKTIIAFEFNNIYPELIAQEIESNSETSPIHMYIKISGNNVQLRIPSNTDGELPQSDTGLDLSILLRNITLAIQNKPNFMSLDLYTTPLVISTASMFRTFSDESTLYKYEIGDKAVHSKKIDEIRINTVRFSLISEISHSGGDIFEQMFLDGSIGTIEGSLSAKKLGTLISTIPLIFMQLTRPIASAGRLEQTNKDLLMASLNAFSKTFSKLDAIPDADHFASFLRKECRTSILMIVHVSVAPLNVSIVHEKSAFSLELPDGVLVLYQNPSSSSLEELNVQIRKVELKLKNPSSQQLFSFSSGIYISYDTRSNDTDEENEMSSIEQGNSENGSSLDTRSQTPLLHSSSKSNECLELHIQPSTSDEKDMIGASQTSYVTLSSSANTFEALDSSSESYSAVPLFEEDFSGKFDEKISDNEFDMISEPKARRVVTPAPFSTTPIKYPKFANFNDFLKSRFVKLGKDFELSFDSSQTGGTRQTSRNHQTSDPILLRPKQQSLFSRLKISIEDQSKLMIETTSIPIVTSFLVQIFYPVSLNNDELLLQLSRKNRFSQEYICEKAEKSATDLKNYIQNAEAEEPQNSFFDQLIEDFMLKDKAMEKNLISEKEVHDVQTKKKFIEKTETNNQFFVCFFIPDLDVEFSSCKCAGPLRSDSSLCFKLNSIALGFALSYTRIYKPYPNLKQLGKFIPSVVQPFGELISDKNKRIVANASLGKFELSYIQKARAMQGNDTNILAQMQSSNVFNIRFYGTWEEEERSSLFLDFGDLNVWVSEDAFPSLIYACLNISSQIELCNSQIKKRAVEFYKELERAEGTLTANSALLFIDSLKNPVKLISKAQHALVSAGLEDGAHSSHSSANSDMEIDFSSVNQIPKSGLFGFEKNALIFSLQQFGVVCEGQSIHTLSLQMSKTVLKMKLEDYQLSGNFMSGKVEGIITSHFIQFLIKQMNNIKRKIENRYMNKLKVPLATATEPSFSYYRTETESDKPRFSNFFENKDSESSPSLETISSSETNSPIEFQNSTNSGSFPFPLTPQSSLSLETQAPPRIVQPFSIASLNLTKRLSKQMPQMESQISLTSLRFVLSLDLDEVTFVDANQSAVKCKISATGLIISNPLRDLLTLTMRMKKANVKYIAKDIVDTEPSFQAKSSTFSIVKMKPPTMIPKPSRKFEKISITGVSVNRPNSSVFISSLYTEGIKAHIKSSTGMIESLLRFVHSWKKEEKSSVPRHNLLHSSLSPLTPSAQSLFPRVSQSTHEKKHSHFVLVHLENLQVAVSKGDTKAKIMLPSTCVALNAFQNIDELKCDDRMSLGVGKMDSPAFVIQDITSILKTNEEFQTLFLPRFLFSTVYSPAPNPSSLPHMDVCGFAAGENTRFNITTSHHYLLLIKSLIKDISDAFEATRPENEKELLKKIKEKKDFVQNEKKHSPKFTKSTLSFSIPRPKFETLPPSPNVLVPTHTVLMKNLNFRLNFILQHYCALFFTSEATIPLTVSNAVLNVSGVDEAFSIKLTIQNIFLAMYQTSQLVQSGVELPYLNVPSDSSKQEQKTRKLPVTSLFYLSPPENFQVSNSGFYHDSGFVTYDNKTLLQGCVACFSFGCQFGLIEASESINFFGNNFSFPKHTLDILGSNFELFLHPAIISLAISLVSEWKSVYPKQQQSVMESKQTTAEDSFMSPPPGFMSLIKLRKYHIAFVASNLTITVLSSSPHRATLSIDIFSLNTLLNSQQTFFQPEGNDDIKIKGPRNNTSSSLINFKRLAIQMQKKNFVSTKDFKKLDKITRHLDKFIKKFPKLEDTKNKFILGSFLIAPSFTFNHYEGHKNFNISARAALKESKISGNASLFPSFLRLVESWFMALDNAIINDYSQSAETAVASGSHSPQPLSDVECQATEPTEVSKTVLGLEIELSPIRCKLISMNSAAKIRFVLPSFKFRISSEQLGIEKTSRFFLQFFPFDMKLPLEGMTIVGEFVEGVVGWKNSKDLEFMQDTDKKDLAEEEADAPNSSFDSSTSALRDALWSFKRRLNKLVPKPNHQVKRSSTLSGVIYVDRMTLSLSTLPSVINKPDDIDVLSVRSVLSMQTLHTVSTKLLFEVKNINCLYLQKPRATSGIHAKGKIESFLMNCSSLRSEVITRTRDCGIAVNNICLVRSSRHEHIPMSRSRIIWNVDAHTSVSIGNIRVDAKEGSLESLVRCIDSIKVTRERLFNINANSSEYYMDEKIAGQTTVPKNAAIHRNTLSLVDFLLFDTNIVATAPKNLVSVKLTMEKAPLVAISLTIPTTVTQNWTAHKLRVNPIPLFYASIPKISVVTSGFISSELSLPEGIQGITILRSSDPPNTSQRHPKQRNVLGELLIPSINANLFRISSSSLKIGISALSALADTGSGRHAFHVDQVIVQCGSSIVVPFREIPQLSRAVSDAFARGLVIRTEISPSRPIVELAGNQHPTPPTGVLSSTPSFVPSPNFGISPSARASPPGLNFIPKDAFFKPGKLSLAVASVIVLLFPDTLSDVEFAHINFGEVRSVLTNSRVEGANESGLGVNSASGLQLRITSEGAALSHLVHTKKVRRFEATKGVSIHNVPIADRIGASSTQQLLKIPQFSISCDFERTFREILDAPLLSALRVGPRSHEASPEPMRARFEETIVSRLNSRILGLVEFFPNMAGFKLIELFVDNTHRRATRADRPDDAALTPPEEIVEPTRESTVTATMFNEFVTNEAGTTTAFTFNSAEFNLAPQFMVLPNMTPSVESVARLMGFTNIRVKLPLSMYRYLCRGMQTSMQITTDVADAVARALDQQRSAAP